MGGSTIQGEDFTPSELETIEELAAQNFAPSQICDVLDRNKRQFMRQWRDTDSKVRKAYELGRLDIERTKREQLQLRVETGDMNAIQMHDKRLREQRFEDIKNEIFNLG